MATKKTTDAATETQQIDVMALLKRPSKQNVPKLSPLQVTVDGMPLSKLFNLMSTTIAKSCDDFTSAPDYNDWALQTLDSVLDAVKNSAVMESRSVIRERAKLERAENKAKRAAAKAAKASK